MTTQRIAARGLCSGGLWEIAGSSAAASLGELTMKRSFLTALGLALVLAFSAGALAKDEKKADTKTITGKSGCSECDGVTKAGHNILLTDKDGTRWVLIGDSESYKEAHKVRMDGKKMTATLA